MPFGQMFMDLPERILPWAVVSRRPRRIFILGNHFLSAAGIARQRVATKGGIGREKTRRNQRINKGDKSACVAPRHGNARAGLDRRPKCGRQFRKTIAPAGRGTVRSRGIKDSNPLILDKRNRLTRRRVRQAKEDKVRIVDAFFPSGRILAFRFIQTDPFDLISDSNALVNPQAGCPRLPINEDLCFQVHFTAPLMNNYTAIIAYSRNLSSI